MRMDCDRAAGDRVGVGVGWGLGVGVSGSVQWSVFAKVFERNAAKKKPPQAARSPPTQRGRCSAQPSADPQYIKNNYWIAGEVAARVRKGGARGAGSSRGWGGCCFWWVAGVGHTQTPTRLHPLPGLETREALT